MRTFSKMPLMRLAVFAVSACVAFPIFAPAAVTAAPVTNAKIEARKRAAAEAEVRMENLQADLELRSEEYAEIEAQLSKTTNDLRLTQEELERATRRLDSSQQRLSRRANAIYRGGNVDMLAVFLNVRDFTDLATRIDLMARIGRSDANTVVEVKSAREAVQEAEATLETRRAEEVVLRQRAGEKRAEVAQALEAQKRYLASVKAEVSKLIAEERERQRKIAEELARRAAAAAAARRNSSKRRVASGDLGESHPEVVAIAMRYLGVPYVWGGTTPAGFDCSGLCQYSYKQLGILLPRTSREQYRFGAFIPADRRDQLQPGDLVFFGRGGSPDAVHHVGIYCGDGNFIEAPYTGSVVRITSLDGRISSRGDYVGATRP